MKNLSYQGGSSTPDKAFWDIDWYLRSACKTPPNAESIIYIRSRFHHPRTSRPCASRGNACDEMCRQWRYSLTSCIITYDTSHHQRTSAQCESCHNVTRPRHFIEINIFQILVIVFMLIRMESPKYIEKCKAFTHEKGFTKITQGVSLTHKLIIAYRWEARCQGCWSTKAVQ